MIGVEKLLQNLLELEETTRREMVERGLVMSTEEIELHPCHSISLQGKLLSHYIITCSSSQKKYFLKVVKDSDGALICNNYLKKTYNEDGSCPYPLILIPEIVLQGTKYYITSFVAGKTLDELSDPLPEKTWDEIADKLLFRLDELANIQAPQYSERSGFVSDNCATGLIRKFKQRLHHPAIAQFPNRKIEAAVERCFSILEQSQYSPPSLLHMDVKPANIIYNSQTGNVSLIDFEFARFGDIDYGWTQVLLSGCNQFNMVYKQCLVPRLTKNRLSLQDAIEIPKFQCYLYYQLMCNLIYYHDRYLHCPNELVLLFEQIADRI
ncbi:phosphotransferase [Pseudoflavonifractor phocaeensis]|uniref:phosphotransferase n=1 Tax=Pseudoflavonifractor phocaeensis TaxID=1870988 RepID=UPI00195C0356|nr:phosphotransferase [Pseudoflavonifractor phocaeensis]